MVIHQPLLKKCHQLIPPNRQLPHHKRHHLANHLVVIVMCTVSHHPHPCLRHHHHQQSHQLLFQNPPHKENLDRPQSSLGQLVQNPSINRHIHRPHPQGEEGSQTLGIFIHLLPNHHRSSHQLQSHQHLHQSQEHQVLFEALWTFPAHCPLHQALQVGNDQLLELGSQASTRW